MRKLIDKWSIKHDKCVKCGTTERKHRAKGLCVNCYVMNLWYFNDEYRAKQMVRINKWKAENPEKVKIIYTKAIKKYKELNSTKVALAQKVYVHNYYLRNKEKIKQQKRNKVQPIIPYGLEKTFPEIAKIEPESVLSQTM